MRFDVPTGSLKNCSSPATGLFTVQASEVVMLQHSFWPQSPRDVRQERRRGDRDGERGQEVPAGVVRLGSWSSPLDSEANAELDLELPSGARGRPPIAALLAVDDHLQRLAAAAGDRCTRLRDVLDRAAVGTERRSRAGTTTWVTWTPARS